MNDKKGIVTFFLNSQDEEKKTDFDSFEKNVEIFRKINQSSIELLSKEGYVCVIVPCYNESCRVESCVFEGNKQ